MLARNRQPIARSQRRRPARYGGWRIFSRGYTGFIALGVVAIAPGCVRGDSSAKTAAQRPATTVAVMPESWATSSPRTGVDAASSARQALGAMRGLRVANPAVTSQALRDEGQPGCGDDIECVRRVGQRALADKALVIELAELGDTVLVRLNLVDVKRGEQQQTHQRVVQHASAARVAQAVNELTREAALPFAQPEPERTRAWYERWYTWVGVGAVAIGAAVVVLLATRGKEAAAPEPDVVVTPP